MTTETATTDDTPAPGQTDTTPPAGGAPDTGQPAAAPDAAADTGAGQSGFGKAAAADTGAADPGAGGDGELPEFGEAYLGEDGKPDLSKVAERLKAADDAEAARLERAGEIPEDPSGYELPTAKELDLPDGVEIEFKDDDPLVQEFFKRAHESGKGKAEAKAELAMHAKASIALVQQLQQQREARELAEFNKVGQKRFDAAKSAIKSVAGEKGDQFAAALDDVSSARLFGVIEDLVTQINGGGASPPGRTQRGSDTGAVDPATRMAQLRQEMLNKQGSN